MAVVQSRLSVILLVLATVGTGSAATFGTVVPLSGNVADIALDEARGRLYVANFGAYRVDVINTASKTLMTYFSVPAPPSAVAVSPDDHFLVVGEYDKPAVPPSAGFQTGTGGLDTYDLNTGNFQHLDLPCPVVAAAFGSDGMALVVCSNTTTQGNVFLFNPATQVLQTIGSVTVTSTELPPGGNSAVVLSTSPSQFIQASSGVSGDLNTIIILAGTVSDPGADSKQSVLIEYSVPTKTITPITFETTPPFGPRSVSVDQAGDAAMVGWASTRFVNNSPYLWAQFPNVTGVFQLGSHAWDRVRNAIYANIPTAAENAVLHVAATDNLEIVERLQLQENLSGKSLMASDMSTMYSASVSGVTILPIAQLSTSIPQVAAAEEDLFFQADACSAGLIRQTLHINNPYNQSAADFTLSLPGGTQGVTFSINSGTTPAQVQVTVDPSMFQGAKGTTSIPVTITSSRGVNLPATVRLLINTKDVNQHGQIVNVPGKIVDTLADPARGLLYLLRQDTNTVLVMNMATRQMVPAPLMRTGNTPTQMSMSQDLHYLIVGNDNSQIATVLDLNTQQPVAPILFPFGHYPRAIGVANGAMFAITRNAGTENPCSMTTPTAFVDQVTFSAPNLSTATTPCTLNGITNPSIFANDLPIEDGVMQSSPNDSYIMMALATGEVAEYDASAGTWTASRKDFPALGGAYGSFTGYLSPSSTLPSTSIDYVVGPNMLDLGLAPLGSPFPDGTAASSGVALNLGVGLRTTATAANAPGVIQRFNPNDQTEFGTTLMSEAPLTVVAMTYTPVGLIGETILSFTRTLAVSADQSTIFASTVSGVTILPSNFDQPQPVPVITSVVSAADGASAAASGGSIDIFGSGLAANSAGAPGYPLPTLLGQACVMVNNITIPLFAASPAELVAELPFGVTGSASLVVRTPGGISAPFAVNVQQTAPAIFHTGSEGTVTGLPAVYRADDGQLLSFTNPIHPDTIITAYLTGLGTATPLPALGAAASSNPIPTVNAPPTVTMGGQSMNVTSAILVPGLATVYQITAQAPHVVQPGNVQLTITSGTSSATLQVRVVSP